MITGPSTRNWAFDGFKVMTEMRLLLTGGTPVPLTSKAFDTLVLLIEKRNRVVTKDELLRSVWSDVEVEEGNLTQQIFLLRKALGETAQQPRYIVTIPGHGYRFIGNVEAISDNLATTGVSPGGEASLPAPPRPGAGLVGIGLAAFGVVVVLAMIYYAGIAARLRGDQEGRLEYLAPAADRWATGADHALQRWKNIQLRVVARWQMAVAWQRRQQD